MLSNKFASTTLFAVVVALSMGACSDSEFKGSSKQKEEPAVEAPPSPPPMLDPISRADPTPSDPTAREDSTIHEAKVCNGTTVKIIGKGGKCPVNHGVFSLDDANSHVFGCCSLPAGDILAAREPQARGQRCGTNEIVVGIASNNALLCQPINTSRYQLASTGKACYYGRGSSGSFFKVKCANIPASLGSLANRDEFGSDGCFGNPPGSLLIGKTGKDCSDMEMSHLIYNVNRQPVVMYR